MDVIVKSSLNVPARGHLRCGSAEFPCALGRSGVGPDKSEGDGKTPTGRFPMRRVLFRGDRLPSPETGLPLTALSEFDGWCDAPDDPAYNTFVTHPYPARAEHLWRGDHRYDLIVILGHNDDPVVPGAGSAIFMHIAAPEFTPTEGCVALRQADLLSVLAQCTPASTILIQAPEP